MILFEKIKKEWKDTLEAKRISLTLENLLSLRTKLLLLSKAVIVFKEARKMDNKTWFESKTLWVNLLAMVSVLFLGKSGVDLPTDWQITALAVINIILRLVTKKPIEW